MELIIFFLACYGLTNIVVSGKIFSPLRKWLDINYPKIGELFHCHMCFGFYAGILIFSMGLKLGLSGLFIPDAILAGFASSGWCWIARVILFKLDEDKL